MGYVIGGIIVVVGWWFFFGRGGDTVTDDVCIDGVKHHITYQKAWNGGKGKQVSDEITGTCDCVTGIGGQISSGPIAGFSRLHPHQESNCFSIGTDGVPHPIPCQSAAGSTSGFGGGSPGFAAWTENPGPAPDPPPATSSSFATNRQDNSPLPDARPRAARAASPGSTFTYTVPFRELPIGVMINGVSTSPTCNASLNPTYFRVYHVANVVKRYDMCSGQTLATINVPALPLQVKVTPDGSEAVVTSYGGAVTFIDTGTNQVSGSITVPTDPNFTPSGVAISPDGAFALVTNYEPPPESYLLLVDLVTKKVTQKIPLDNVFPQSVFINPDGTLAWIIYPWANSVEVMDIMTGTIVQTFTVVEPFSLVFNATGTQLFLSSGTGSIEVIDTKTYATITTIPADFGATDLQLSPDGAFVVVNNSSAQSITVIETASLTATTTTIGGAPLGAVLVPTN